jgi:signal transduction histidine kinase/ligand-binding sensor domain-containing protein
MKAIPLLLLGVLFSFAGSVWPATPELTLRQVNHRMYTAAQGAPSDIAALAQTPDGTLWIGSPAGLTRFDGVRFVPYPGPAEEPLRSTNISSLFVAPDGRLWIGFRPGGISSLKGGHVTSYGESDGLPDGTVAQFALDRNGSLWAAARTGLAQLKGKRWEKLADQPKPRIYYGVLVDRAGTLWVATLDGLLARVAGESRFREVDRRGYSDPRGRVIAASPDGRIWTAFNRELIRFDRPTDPQPGGVVTVRGISGGPLLFDDEGNLWVSDMNSRDLLRVPSRALTQEGQREVIVPSEKFLIADVLNAGRVLALLQDRERNIWVGTTYGLHRFSRSNVVRDGAPPCFQGAFSEAAAAFAAGNAGVLWMACNDGSAPHVNEIRDGAVVSRQSTPIFNVAYRDAQGTVWFGGPTALGHLESGRIIPMALPPQVRGRPVHALVRDSSGALWVSASRAGIFRFHDGEWSAYGHLDALPRGYALVATADGDSVWFGYPNNRIARVTGRIVQLFDATLGLEVGNVLAILAEGREVWAGGELGIARFDGTRFVSIRSASGVPFTGVSGIVRARNGDFWLNGTNGIAHIARQEIERVVADPGHRVRSDIFDYLDGVPGTAVQIRPQPSAIETTDGRIWFSMTSGVISIDATHLLRNPLPPPITIWSLTTGAKQYPNRGAELRLPIHSTSLQIDYSAGSLTVPERVHFRYKLEDSDREWQEVGTRREALYTNLGPGHYRFRVSAANNDGVWNNAGASIRFTIPPAFYQTRWFYTLCVLASVAILVALYRVRMRQVAAQVRGRLEARLAERERIARELHDTLLQGMQGLIWRFEAAADRIAPGEPARRLMGESLHRANKLLAEGRDRVKDLRPAASEVADLAQALAVEGEQFAQLHSAVFRVSVHGTCRDLHPIVREEGFLIGREALTNAFRHANARDIEAEVTYGATTLHVRIRDDGRGISAAVLDEGKPGHFGLLGMRERANKLGAHFEVWSSPGAGTEVDLRVPANVAYRRSQAASRGIRSWLARLRSSAQEH